MKRKVRSLYIFQSHLWFKMFAQIFWHACSWHNTNYSISLDCQFTEFGPSPIYPTQVLITYLNPEYSAIYNHMPQILNHTESFFLFAFSPLPRGVSNTQKLDIVRCTWISAPRNHWKKSGWRRRKELIHPTGTNVRSKIGRKMSTNKFLVGKTVLLQGLFKFGHIVTQVQIKCTLRLPTFQMECGFCLSSLAFNAVID